MTLCLSIIFLLPFSFSPLYFPSLPFPYISFVSLLAFSFPVSPTLLHVPPHIVNPFVPHLLASILPLFFSHAFPLLLFQFFLIITSLFVLSSPHSRFSSHCLRPITFIVLSRLPRIVLSSFTHSLTSFFSLVFTSPYY